ncbi:T9SS type B sorting domain-containing protein [Flavobacterium xinjiangense]|uniref:Gliding motility-associated C-terminal domain-containing protein n=1 Tax=Flavobacterium xinjiangense TaxID=178356 RepID=A0A1M7ISZ7_9FLAO|nr:choice-of-anchor L domain-containing protein [Flavobacterium xinjiangense]SHM43457.1 gliding motility-associated C-terminal domain-containing protein [Flavobacterium xinjiangense]
MKSINKIIVYIFICCYSYFATAQSISVNDSYTAQQLVENVLVNNSSCVSISNPIATGDNSTPGKRSYGYFNNQGGSFPFTEGVLLSTWSSTNSEAPYVANVPAGDSNAWLGDSDLNTVLGKSTLNATVLEFDFTPLTNFLSFDYIFASNEYQSFFPCSYSDAFAFLIKEAGSAGPYQNLAIIPNTTTPVSSTNVHPLITPVNPPPAFGINGCPAINDAFFGAFNTSSSPINYAGQTVVLNAKTTVIPNKKYHIKLVIADNESTTFNSAVFIKAGSFTSKIDLGSNRLFPNNPICYGENFIIDTKLSGAYSYKWYRNGSPIPILGEIGPSLKVTDTGVYKVEVELGSPNCIATGEIKIDFTPQIVLKNTSIFQCDENGDGIAIFDLNKAEAIIKNNNSNLSQMFFFENSIDAQKNQNPIPNPNSYTNKSNNQIVIAKVLDTYGCPIYAELTLSISNKTITPLAPIIVCDDDGSSDGIYQFDLMGIATSGYFSGIGNNIFVSFYSNSADAYLEKNALSFLFKNTIPFQQTLYARVLTGSDCYAITPITLVINTFNPPNFENENIPLCEGSALNLSVSNNFLSYLWNTLATTNSILVSTPGDYSVKVTNTNGCTATKKFNVSASGIATITDAIVTDFAANENSVLVEYSGVGNYEFSLDGSFFQDNPLFTGVAAGEYLVYANDKNGCGLSIPFKIYVLDYPRFFTPNGDGYNDFWEIKNLDLLPKSTVTIFNRYGKLLKQFNSVSSGWNGTFNGYLLPADDYWFNITFEENKTIKGHFSLKR